MIHPGKLIVVEGIDGAGTTTQIERYAEHLRQKRRVVRVTREPSQGPIGTMLRQALGGRVQLGRAHHSEIMALLFAADRLHHLATEIEPWLRDGAVVLCDRYDLSSIAYQTATAAAELLERVDFEAWVRTLNRFALRPDLTVIVNVTPAVAEARRRLRPGAPDIYEYSELQTKLAGLYRDAERILPNDRIVHLDGDPSLDEVSAALSAVLDPFVLGQ